MVDTPSHHLIYGHCIDFITGDKIVDTDDERLRQKIARFLVEKKGFAKNELEARLKIETLFTGQFVVSTIDLTVRISGKPIMVIRYGPGSLVTREKPALAAARVLDPLCQIPIAVVTNGVGAEVLDVATGKVMGEGLDSIPDRNTAEGIVHKHEFQPPPEGKRKERELRILNAYDVEICCAGGPCALPGAREG